MIALTEDKCTASVAYGWAPGGINFNAVSSSTVYPTSPMVDIVPTADTTVLSHQQYHNAFTPKCGTTYFGGMVTLVTDVACPSSAPTASPPSATCPTYTYNDVANGIILGETAGSNWVTIGGSRLSLASEICTNGIDDNCDGLIDYADPLCIAPTGQPSNQPSAHPSVCFRVKLY